MDLINGALSVLSPTHLLFCFLGTLLGTLVGVLPGLGPASTLAILLPITVYLDPTGAIIMLSGVYYGAAYGGSTTSILANIPGEVSSIPTTLDGHAMAKQGRAGPALWISAVGSFVAGTAGAVLLSVGGPGLAKIAIQFGPPEYLALLVFSFATLITMSSGSAGRNLAMAIVGLLLGSSGVDPMTGVSRFNFGSVSMMRGFEIIPIVIGLFGIAEVLANAESGIKQIFSGSLGRMMPRGAELRRGLAACVRGTAIGLPLGLLPGVGPVIGSFLAYDMEKRLSKTPEQFGHGLIEGVAAPEAANNAVSQANFLPLLALGIPTAPSMAIILAALVMYGIQPGPMLFVTNHDFAWAVIGSMYIGNVMLLVLNLPLVGLWARISTVPYRYLGPIILAVCVVGAYSARNTMFDVWVAIGAGVAGFLLKRAGWPLAPVVIGIILGPMVEFALRQSLSIGGVEGIFNRPIPLTFYALTVVVVLVWTALRFRTVRKVSLPSADAAPASSEPR